MSVYWSLAVSFFKTGLFAFGGGPAIIPLVEREVVHNYHWLGRAEFADVLAMANALPGPIATKMALCVGLKVGGPIGAAVALVSQLLPSSVLIIILTVLYYRYHELPSVGGVMKAIRPVVIAILLATVAQIAPAAVHRWDTFLIAIVAFCVVFYLNIHPIFAIIAAGLIGLFLYR
jgi:chromate transporter